MCLCTWLPVREEEKGSVRLRKPCPHDRYEEHVCIDGRWVSQTRMMRITDDERKLLTFCPGGEFLPEGAINRFEVIDHTSNGEGRILSKWEDFNFDVEFDVQDGGRTLKVFLIDALASQVGESE